MKTSYILVSCFIFLLFSCSKSDNTEPPPGPVVPKKLLTLKINNSIKTDASDDWVLIHDKNGKLLEYKSFESGATLTIETLKTVPEDKIALTFFMHLSDTTRIVHDLQTYFFNSTGQTWEHRVYPYTQPIKNLIGYYNVEVYDLQLGSAYEFSTRKDINFSGGSWSSASNTLHATVRQFEGTPDHFFYMSDPTGKPKYTFLRNVEVNDSIEIFPGSLRDFDKTVEVSFPSTPVRNINYFVTKLEAEHPYGLYGYAINSNFSHVYTAFGSDNRTKITLGYLDTFPEYTTSLTVRYPGYSYYYGKTGAPPTSISLPLTAQFNLQNTSLSNFSFTSNQNFGMRNSIWEYRATSTKPVIFNAWNFWATSNAMQPAFEMPNEFATKYPSFIISELKHSYSTFSIEQDSYEHAIEVTFKGMSRSLPREGYSITIQ